MSAENVALLRDSMFPDGVDLVPLVNQGRFGEAVDPALFDPDVVVAFMIPGGPPAEFRGLEGLVNGWSDWLVPWESYVVEVEELIDAGDHVLAYVVLRGQTRHDGVRLEQPAAAVITIADRKIVRLEFHLDRREAQESAGLPA